MYQFAQAFFRKIAVIEVRAIGLPNQKRGSMIEGSMALCM